MDIDAIKEREAANLIDARYAPGEKKEFDADRAILALLTDLDGELSGDLADVLLEYAPLIVKYVRCATEQRIAAREAPDDYRGNRAAVDALKAVSELEQQIGTCIYLGCKNYVERHREDYQ